MSHPIVERFKLGQMDAGGTIAALEEEIYRLEKAAQEPANTDLPPIKELLTRDQRDALVAANAFLAVMQGNNEELFNRIQGVLDEISDMLYG
jgi:small-conductance mechanosensitive channel